MGTSETTQYFPSQLDESYRHLPSIYLVFLSIWFLSACSWTINTYKNRHFQMNNLQWTLASVPLIKALQLTLSFLFWYSCFYLHVCSLWMSFGVYVTGVLFQTASFVSFFLISHGYSITCESLSLTERRTTAALGPFIALFTHRWTFRSQELAPRFSVMPTLKSKAETMVPPIFSIEMDAETFRTFRSHEWHIGVPTSGSHDERYRDSVIVIIQHPH
ncbi:uncharacterized protein LOC110810173 [Carica papaya]|uniref:uncharacterized protein LOC110810173 n=1 Tax=Carica papaya TaxID=3649 RepID=UPI000B8CE29E|nr:uncharacterized protein LOC110810173 [Carica papaya]